MASRTSQDALPDRHVIPDIAVFGAWIRALRRRQGLRIDDAAALCGVSVQLLHALETGTRSVGLEKALGVARQLGLAVLVVPAEELPAALHALEPLE